VHQRGRGGLCGGSGALLGTWYRHGKEGLQQDHVKAAALFRTAADRGQATAQSALAVCYLAGQGVEQNDELAVEWGRKAADQGEQGAQFFGASGTRLGSWV